MGGVQSSIGVIDGGVSREVMGYMGYLECTREKKFKVLLEEWRSGGVEEWRSGGVEESLSDGV